MGFSGAKLSAVTAIPFPQSISAIEFPFLLKRVLTSKNMETQIDFVQCLKPNMSLKILTYLDDSADLIRASAVSRHWQNIVVSNGLSKNLCVRKYPQLATITSLLKLSHDNSDDSGEREHRAYASLFQALTSFPQTYCIADPVSAPSTDNYPEESIMNTLDPRNKILYRYSYWSSKGSDDPEASETLIYKLTANLCVITEINLHPFQAVFQMDFPIYSSKSVRFRMGHPKSWNELDHDFIEAQECADDKFIWTYTSEFFPVARENGLQRFKLPEPVVCIGGFLQIELLGRVQEQEADGKYYICVTHVQAIGRQLSPAFSVEFSEPTNSVSLKYDAVKFGLMKNVSSGNSSSLHGVFATNETGDNTAALEVQFSNTNLEDENDPHVFVEPGRPSRKGKPSVASSSDIDELLNKIDKFNTLNEQESKQRIRIRDEKFRLMQEEQKVRVDLMRKQQQALDEEQQRKDMDFILEDHSTYSGPMLEMILNRKRQMAQRWGWHFPYSHDTSTS